MSGDNRVFNVNGEGMTLLKKTLELVFSQGDFDAYGFKITEKHGFILYQFGGYGTPFPSMLNAAQVMPLIEAWLASKPKVEMAGWDADADHDGSNGIGWRVYCEDWGHVADESAAFVAIKPACMWYGK